MSSALSAATQAPHRKANSRVRGGSGSQRSTHRNAHTTGPTGSSAHTAPTSTAPTPMEPLTSPSTTSPQTPNTTSPATVPSTARRWRPGVGR